MSESSASPEKVFNDKYMVCNTGRCGQKLLVTPQLRPHIEDSLSGVRQIKVKHTGLCPRCGSDAGFVCKYGARFAHELASMFEF